MLIRLGMSKAAEKIKRGADRHYSLMKTDDIKELPVHQIADEDCWLFLWVTNNYLVDGLDCMRAWGFRYVTNLVWAKPSFGAWLLFQGST